MDTYRTSLTHMVVMVTSLCTVLNTASSEQILSLDGKQWKVTNGNRSIVALAMVPGNIYTDLARAGILGDPYYRLNDIAYRWVSYDNWTYTRELDVPPSLLAHRAVGLVAEGLDTVASIAINGRSVGRADNMFRRYVFDVRHALKVRVKGAVIPGVNHLSVTFTSPVLYARSQAARYPYTIPDSCPPPDQHGECYFNFIRKEASSFSWDWGPAFPTVGIWKNLSIVAFDELSIKYVTTETNRTVDQTWVLRVAVFFDAVVTKATKTVTLTLNLPELRIKLQKNVTLSYENVAQVEIQIPKSVDISPWWPNSHGSQRLYILRVHYTTETGHSSPETTHTVGHSSGATTTRVGFRTVELVQDKIANATGLTFYFRVNGSPVFMKGSNWIPADAFQDRVTPARLRRLLTSAKDANMNMLRVWGGGIYESDAFYALCDELGILVWQDMMFACALYPSDPEFLDNVRQEVTHQIRRLKSHPSIAVWAGNNENEWGLAPYRGQPGYPQYYRDYLALYRDTVAVVIATEDQSRPFLPSSPSDGAESLREGWVARDPQDVHYGDIHHYDYSSDSWSPAVFPVPRFASEYGLQSWCSLGTLATVSRPSDWAMDSTFVKYRQHHPDGNPQLLSEVRGHLNFSTAGRSARESFEEFIYLTQINQAAGIKTETEVYRRGQGVLTAGKGLTMGALYWQLNDIWPGPTWASLEYGGKWKMLHYYAKKFFSVSLVSPVVRGSQLEVYYVHDHGRSAQLSARSQLVLSVSCYLWSSLKPAKVWTVPFTEPSAPSSVVFTHDLPTMLKVAGCPSVHHCFLYFSVATPGGSSVLTQNWLLLSNFTTVQGLRKPTLKASDFHQLTPDLTQFTLTTDSVAPFVWMDVGQVKGHFLDNGFIMVDHQMTLTFTSWQKQEFNLSKALHIRSLSVQ